jgi:general secretion pathway protein A
MLKAYAGLQRSPFGDAERLDSFFASPTHKEALARMHFLVQERRSLGILSGCRGMGKSRVLLAFCREARELPLPVCVVNLLGLELREFLWSAAAGLGVNPRLADDGFALWRRISDRIEASRRQQQTTVLLLDDADEASHDVLIHVLRLVKTHPESLTAILALEPSRIMRLGGDLLQLSQLRMHLEPWEAGDVQEYLRTRLSDAGGAPEMFSEAAAGRLHELTGGVPRWVHQLAELALLAATAQGQEWIDTETIEAAYHELSAAYHEQPSTPVM